MHIHKLESFHGTITAALLAMKLDSRRVLNAVNSWIGEQEAKTRKDDATAKLAGKETKKSGDQRVIRIDRTITTRVETKLCPQGLLFAFNDEFGKIADKFGCRVELIEFPPMVETWLSAKRESFAMREDAPKPESVSVSVETPVEA